MIRSLWVNPNQQIISISNQQFDLCHIDIVLHTHGHSEYRLSESAPPFPVYIHKEISQLTVHAPLIVPLCKVKGADLHVFHVVLLRVHWSCTGCPCSILGIVCSPYWSESQWSSFVEQHYFCLWPAMISPVSYSQPGLAWVKTLGIIALNRHWTAFNHPNWTIAGCSTRLLIVAAFPHVIAVLNLIVDALWPSWYTENPK